MNEQIAKDFAKKMKEYYKKSVSCEHKDGSFTFTVTSRKMLISIVTDLHRAIAMAGRKVETTNARYENGKYKVDAVVA